jgi:hypothetical protein
MGAYSFEGVVSLCLVGSGSVPLVPVNGGITISGVSRTGRKEGMSDWISLETSSGEGVDLGASDMSGYKEISRRGSR